MMISLLQTLMNVQVVCIIVNKFVSIPLAPLNAAAKLATVLEKV